MTTLTCEPLPLLHGRGSRLHRLYVERLLVPLAHGDSGYDVPVPLRKGVSDCEQGEGRSPDHDLLTSRDERRFGHDKNDGL